MDDLISKQISKEALLKRGFFPVMVKCALEAAPAVVGNCEGFMEADRERLVELLKYTPCDGENCFECRAFDNFKLCDNIRYGKRADHLIANGVTVQKHGQWIIASDGTHFCSECGCDAPYTWDDIDRFFINSADDVPDRITDCCPNCGAKMDTDG